MGGWAAGPQALVQVGDLLLLSAVDVEVPGRWGVGRIRGAPAALEPSGRRLLEVAEQHDLLEVDPHRHGQVAELVDELRSRHQLRHHHVVPRLEVDPGGRQRCGPGQQSRGVPVSAPAADRGAHLVDVDHQGEWMLRGVPSGDRRLAARGRPVEQDEPGHRSAARTAPLARSHSSSSVSPDRSSCVGSAIVRSAASRAVRPSQPTQLRSAPSCRSWLAVAACRP